MKLSSEQIAQIKSWISKRGFTHTDVQYEIIDHVASAIEDKMEEKPKISLEGAFNEVHRSFGVYGFAEVEEAITSRLNKELWRSYWAAAKEILLSRKILIPILIGVLVHLLSKQFPINFDGIILGGILGFCVFTLVYAFREQRSKKYLKSYLSFRMSYGIIPIMASIVFNFRYLYLELVSPIWTAILLGILSLAMWAVFVGSKEMINKTEKLHKLYE
ncbi:hypothetical protein SAMN05661096_00292 [Marivirga sericea]|uniref:Uncharacterized protein n=1 Tax=Marivirga sericea TaxID=1028 RepID=A0A1X7I6C5_9BACT|nr:hypothetical protein [Marivirga sericea]SMG10125.1 hypothetical protein SAMN05661096_00292 [Marivirga sericea]